MEKIKQVALELEESVNTNVEHSNASKTASLFRELMKLIKEYKED